MCKNKISLEQKHCVLKMLKKILIITLYYINENQIKLYVRVTSILIINIPPLL